MMMMMKFMIMTTRMMTMTDDDNNGDNGVFFLHKLFFEGILYLKLHYSDERWFQTSVPLFHGIKK